jgi:hypothetical protein
MRPLLSYFLVPEMSADRSMGEGVRFLCLHDRPIPPSSHSAAGLVHWVTRERGLPAREVPVDPLALTQPRVAEVVNDFETPTWRI